MAGRDKTAMTAALSHAAPPRRRAGRLALALVVGACLLPAGSAHAQASTVRATPSEVSRALFVAGDVRRLSRNPSGTVDTVLEKVLQQLYRENPELAPEEAQADIQRLGDGLAAAGAATSTATLAVQPGNQRVLAILAGLRRHSNPPARVASALTAVADEALTESSKTAKPEADAFSAAVDAQSTLLYGGFSPTTTLDATARLAAANPRFGRARDLLWEAVSGQSVRDGAAAQLAGDPDLRDDAVRTLVAGRAADGSLTIAVGDVEDRVRTALDTINAQNAVAIDNYRTVVQTCPGAGCEHSREVAREDAALARGRIAAEEASLAAAGALMRVRNARYADAIQAEAQAAAQIANGVNSYYARSAYGEIVHSTSDAAGLVLSLAVAQVNPLAAVTGVVTIVGSILDESVGSADADALILEGLQDVSGQLSAFARATAVQFEGLDARLQRLTQDVSVLADRLSTQLVDLRTQIDGLATALTRLQGSVDRLHSEIQRLFRQGAVNEINTIANQWLGRGGLDEIGLRAPAGALYTAATDIALRDTVLNPPSAFDAPAAAAIADIDTNVNFFAFFPTRVSDSTAGIAWPDRALTDTCTPGEPARLLCLPDPSFWAGSSRAYAQLLLENRDVVTRDRLAQIDAMVGRGRSLKEAFDRITEHDAGDSGTGSRLFNAVLDYYRSWVGRDAERASGPPTLLQALRAVRAEYLEDVRPGDVFSTVPWVDPYGSARQSLDGIDVHGFAPFTNISTAGGTAVIPNLRSAPVGAGVAADRGAQRGAPARGRPQRGAASALDRRPAQPRRLGEPPGDARVPAQRRRGSPDQARLAHVEYRELRRAELRGQRPAQRRTDRRDGLERRAPLRVRGERVRVPRHPSRSDHHPGSRQHRLRARRRGRHAADRDRVAEAAEGRPRSRPQGGARPGERRARRGRACRRGAEPVARLPLAGPAPGAGHRRRPARAGRRRRGERAAASVRR
jgi:hypothetical protein